MRWYKVVCWAPFVFRYYLNFVSGKMENCFHSSRVHFTYKKSLVFPPETQSEMVLYIFQMLSWELWTLMVEREVRNGFCHLRAYIIRTLPLCIHFGSWIFDCPCLCVIIFTENQIINECRYFCLKQNRIKFQFVWYTGSFEETMDSKNRFPS